MLRYGTFMEGFGGPWALRFPVFVVFDVFWKIQVVGLTRLAGFDA